MIKTIIRGKHGSHNIYHAICDGCGVEYKVAKGNTLNGELINDSNTFRHVIGFKDRYKIRDKDRGRRVPTRMRIHLTMCPECAEKFSASRDLSKVWILDTDGKTVFRERRPGLTRKPDQFTTIPSEKIKEMVIAAGYSEEDLDYVIKFNFLQRSASVEAFMKKFDSMYNGRRIKIEEVTYGRMDGGDEKKGFDFFTAVVNPMFADREELKSYIHKNKTGVTKTVIRQIAKRPDFMKYGIPVNFIIGTEITITRDSLLVYKFNLKTKPTT